MVQITADGYMTFHFIRTQRIILSIRMKAHTFESANRLRKKKSFGLIRLLMLILNSALNCCNVLNRPTCIHACIRARRCLWEYSPIYIKIITHALQDWHNFLREVYWMRIQAFFVVTQSLFVFLALQPFWLYFSQPRRGL